MTKRSRSPVAPNPHGGSANRSERRDHHRSLIDGWARTTIGKHAPELLSNSRSLVVAEKTVTLLVAALRANRSMKEIKWAQATLTALLRKGVEELAWEVKKFPDPIITLPRPPSPFRPETFARAALLTEIIRRHEELLEWTHARAMEGYAELDSAKAEGSTRGRAGRHGAVLHTAEELLAGRILFSAIVSGGLLCRSLVMSLPDAMTLAMAAIKEYIWIDFDIPTKDPEDRPACRRWFPDPVTACLILRWRLQGYTWPAGSHGNPDRLLERYLKHLGATIQLIADKKSPKDSERICTVSFSGLDERQFNTYPQFRQASSIEFLLDAAETRLRTKVPGVLVDFAMNLNAGRSLPPTAWWRTLLDKRLDSDPAAGVSPVEMPGISRLEEVESWPNKSKFNSGPGRLSAQRALVRELGHCFGKGNKYVQPAKALSALNLFDERVQGEAGPLLFALSRWARWCLTVRKIGKGKLRAKSVRRYLDAFAMRLVELGGHLNPTKMTAEDFQALYDQVAASKQSPRNRAFAHDRLIEFHRFLMVDSEVPRLDWDEQTFSRDAPSPPDANIISETEFKRVIQTLESWIKDERTREMLVLMTTVAYRLGLRRDEIAGIERASIQGVSERGSKPRTARPQLWIHTTSLSSVKRTASVRRLPLALLMQKAEFDRFFAWAALRQREDGTSDEPNGLLFCAAGRPREKIEDKGYFSLITAALRFVTGEPWIRFHHLRHSFITLLIARLLSIAITGPDAVSLPESWQGVDALESEMLHKRLLQSKRPVRREVYLVSALAGHLDPQETTQTYSHGLDWLLGRHLAYDHQRLSLKLIATLDGRSVSAFAAARSRQGEKSRVLGLRDVRRTLSRLIEESLATQPPIFIIPPAMTMIDDAMTVNALPQPRDLLDFTLDEAYALVLSGPRGLTASARAQLFDLPIKLVMRFMNRAGKLAGTKTASRNRKQSRSRFLRHQGKSRKSADASQRPEVAGLGVALPREPGERREARQVFRSLLEACRNKLNAMPVLFESYTRCVSRTDSELLVATEQDAKNIRALLQIAEIGIKRVKVQILSWPEPIDSKSGVPTHLAEIFGITRSQVIISKPLPRTKSKTGFGRIAISVAETGSTRAALGWKCACFYAAVVTNTVSGLASP